MTRIVDGKRIVLLGAALLLLFAAGYQLCPPIAAVAATAPMSSGHEGGCAPSEDGVGSCPLQDQMEPAGVLADSEEGAAVTVATVKPPMPALSAMSRCAARLEAPPPQTGQASPLRL